MWPILALGKIFKFAFDTKNFRNKYQLVFFNPSLWPHKAIHPKLYKNDAFTLTYKIECVCFSQSWPQKVYLQLKLTIFSALCYICNVFVQRLLQCTGTLILKFFLCPWKHKEITLKRRVLRITHGLRTPNEAFFHRNPKLLGHLGYLRPIYQHPFWYCESLVHVFH